MINIYSIKYYPISLGRNKENKFVLAIDSTDKLSVWVLIMKIDLKTGNKECVYKREFGDNVRFYNQKWNLTGKDIVVVYGVSGSGQFLSYDVLSEENGKIKKYISEEAIAYGGIFFKDGKLILSTGDRYYIWIKKKDKFLKRRYTVEGIPGVKVIKYSISKKTGKYKIKVDKTNYTVPVGTVIQFIRTDDNDILASLGYYVQEGIKSLEPQIGFVIKITKPTTVTIDINAGIGDLIDSRTTKKIIINAE